MLSVVPLQSAMVSVRSYRSKRSTLKDSRSGAVPLPDELFRRRELVGASANSPPPMEQRIIISVCLLQSAMVPSLSEQSVRAICLVLVPVPLPDELFRRRELVDASGETHPR